MATSLLDSPYALFQKTVRTDGETLEKEKLNPMVRKSRMLYGVCDQTDLLNQGECQVRVTIEGGLKRTLTGLVVVYRSPSYLLGDVRVLKSVRHPELDHLVDCVVFPTNGDRPHADEMAGGDLDGDKFFVCWVRRAKFTKRNRNRKKKNLQYRVSGSFCDTNFVQKFNLG